MSKIPMRTSQLVDDRPSRVDRASHGVARPTKTHLPRKQWHKAVKDLFNSFAESGQVDFWQESDWAIAYLVCDDLSDYKKQHEEHIRSRKLQEAWIRDASWLKPEERREQGLPMVEPLVTRDVGAMKLQLAHDILARLLVSEADRRRVHIELDSEVDNGEEFDAKIRVLDDYRKRLATG